MLYKKQLILGLALLSMLGLIFSGCISESSENLSIEYNIVIDNPAQEDFKLSLPTIILGNRFYNTPRDLKPIVGVDDYSVINGDAILSYNKIDNTTLLQVDSSSEKVEIELTKKKFSKEKYSEYKDVDYYDSRVIPFLNSYYNGTSGNYGSMEDKIGIIYEGKSSVNVTIDFKMIEEEGDQYTLDDSFTVEDNGFQLKEITIRFKQPAP